ncbi:hypothetical protein KI387_036825 [Taxus chinensis]|uniref:CCHC-type domain-containing protein n=1 Tax=Taxus chinensis TaxID=29808 RepID=A0AA38KU82_TAXCH|nr:hypothetical protein KI387_036825 [Taxus chinensis]
MHQGMRSFSMAIYACNVLGHREKDCERRFSRNGQSWVYERFFNGHCYECTEYGHKAIDCGWNLSSYQSKGKKSVMCYNCQNFGHIATYCPDRSSRQNKGVQKGRKVKEMYIKRSDPMSDIKNEPEHDKKSDSIETIKVINESDPTNEAKEKPKPVRTFEESNHGNQAKKGDSKEEVQSTKSEPIRFVKEGSSSNKMSDVVDKKKEIKSVKPKIESSKSGLLALVENEPMFEENHICLSGFQLKETVKKDSRISQRIETKKEKVKTIKSDQSSRQEGFWSKEVKKDKVDLKPSVPVKRKRVLKIDNNVDGRKMEIWESPKFWVL